MKINFKNQELDQYGYKLKNIEIERLNHYALNISLNFETQEGNNYSIGFDICKKGLITQLKNILFLKGLKGKDIATIIKNCVELVNKDHTFYGSAYIDIAERIPLNVIESEMFAEIKNTYPKKYQNILKLSTEKKKTANSSLNV